MEELREDIKRFSIKLEQDYSFKKELLDSLNSIFGILQNLQCFFLK
jgi:hypothetical protein